MANRLVDAAGHPLQLRGVNRSGLEYACIQGWGFFDGPADDASVAAIAAWGANAVRVPLNEDCWLGINTPTATFSGDAYRTTVKEYVDRLHRHGMAAILDLHWAQLGDAAATGTPGRLPDAGHAPAFWTSVASAFAGDKSVLFDLYNEPHDVSWTCWRDGCILPEGWAGAGMQSLVNAVRAGGADQPIMVGGLAYANDVSGWSAYAPHDPARQLVASFHVYNFNPCRTVSCWDSQVGGLAAGVPVVTGEVGEDDRTPKLLNQFLPWADAHGVSYLGWTWNTWKDPTTLISDYSGTPTTFGAGLRSHLLSFGAPPPPAASGMMAPISRDRPVYASSEVQPADRANDDDYSTVWRSSGYPCWLAYDLSAVPAAERTTVYSQWSNTTTYNYDNAVFPGPTYNLPGDYVLEANAAPGGHLPAGGWVTLVNVTGNTLHSAAHVLDMTGYNWLRFRATAGNPRNGSENVDLAMNWDLFDARSAVSDSWMFFGDSITAGAMTNYPGNLDRKGKVVDTFAKQINASRPSHFPAQQDGGIGGLTLEYTISHNLLQNWLPKFPGRYVAISLGTNDANSESFSPDKYYENLMAAITLVEQAGKVPVIPTLVASKAKWIQVNGPALNAKVREIYQSRPEVVAGPDLWALFSDHPQWISGDNLHPTDTGYGEMRIAWANSALMSVYR